MFLVDLRSKENAVQYIHSFTSLAGCRLAENCSLKRSWLEPPSQPEQQGTAVLLSKKKHVTVLASVAAPPCEKVVEQMILPCQPPPCNPSPCNDTCESVSHSPSCANYMCPNTWSSSPLNTSQAFVTSFSLVMSFFLAAAGKTYLISGFRIFTARPNTCMYLISANPKMSCVEENKL